MLCWILCIVVVIAIALARHQNMHSVMNVIIPLSRIEVWAPLSIAPQITRCIVVVLKHEMNMARGTDLLMNGVGNLFQSVRIGLVFDGMHCVEAQAVKVVLLKPVQSVVDEIVADSAAAGAVEI